LSSWKDSGKRHSRWWNHIWVLSRPRQGERHAEVPPDLLRDAALSSRLHAFLQLLFSGVQERQRLQDAAG